MTDQQTKAPALKRIHARRVAEFTARLRESAPDLMKRVDKGELKFEIVSLPWGLHAKFQTVDGKGMGTIKLKGREFRERDFSLVKPMNRCIIPEDV